MSYFALLFVCTIGLAAAAAGASTADPVFIVIQDCELWNISDDSALTTAVLAKYFIDPETGYACVVTNGTDPNIHRFRNCRFTFKARLNTASSTAGQKRAAVGADALEPPILTAEARFVLAQEVLRQRLQQIKSSSDTKRVAPIDTVDVQIILDELQAKAMGVLLKEFAPPRPHAKRNNGDNVEQISHDATTDVIAETTLLWHLDRITSPGVDNAFLLPPQYLLSNANTSQTKPVDIYVVDSGIRDSHVEFADAWRGNATRVRRLYNAFPSLAWDCAFHGTHVAALAGGNYAARLETSATVNHTIWDVRVLDCTGSGSYSHVINGLYAVLDQCSIYNRTRASIVNMSLGGGYSVTVLDMIATVARELQILCDAAVVAAAGNDAADACVSIPGALQGQNLGELTIVAALNPSNEFATSYSNYGRCVTFIEPGTDIVSAIHTCDTCYGIASGTSMATPVLVAQMVRHKAAEPSLWYSAAAGTHLSNSGMAGTTAAHARALLFDEVVFYHTAVTADTRPIPNTPAETPIRVAWLKQDAPLLSSLPYAQKPPSQGDFTNIISIAQPPVLRSVLGSSGAPAGATGALLRWTLVALIAGGLVVIG